LIERLGLSYGLGIGFITLIMFTLSAINIKLNLFNILLLPLLFAIASSSFILLKKYPYLNLSINSVANTLAKKILTTILLLLIVIQVGFIFTSTLIKPIQGFDSLWRYSLVSHAVFEKGTFKDPFILNFAEDNPYLSPLAQSFVFFCVNGWNEILGASVYPFLFLSLLLVFYAVLRKRTSALKSLIFTFLLGSLPFMNFHAATTYSDFPQTYYYSISVFYLLLFMFENGSNKFSSLIIAAFFSAFSILAKRHGLYLAGINFFVLSFYLCLSLKEPVRLKLKKLSVYTLIIIFICLPWFIYQNAIFKSALSNLVAPFTASEQIINESSPTAPGTDKTSTILNISLQKMFLSGNWQLLWFLFILSVTFAAVQKNKTALWYLGVLIGLNLIYIFASFRFTAAFPYLLDGTLLNRLMLYHIPAVLYFAALSFTQKIEVKNKKKR
jgi:hypothetical protein